jgi:hypothetical protein
MRLRTLAGVATLALCLHSQPAQAEVAVGEAAPNFTAGDYFNTEPIDLAALKGRVVLLELFSTT